MAVEAGVGGKSKSFSKRSYYKAPVRKPTVSVKKPVQPTPPRVRPPTRQASFKAALQNRPVKKPLTTAQVAQGRAANAPRRAANAVKAAAMTPAQRSAEAARNASKVQNLAKSTQFKGAKAIAGRTALALAGAAKLAAAAKAAAAKKSAARPTSTGGSSRTGGAVAKPIAAVAKPVAKAVAKPAAAPVAPKPTTVQGSGTAAKATTISGKGAFGRFKRQREGRGPMTGESLTPEQLQSIARQRIVNYH